MSYPVVETLKFACLRVALVVASFGASSSAMLGVTALFDSASHQPLLRDAPSARQAIAKCEVRSTRDQRRDCVHRVVAQAEARDAGVPAATPTTPPTQFAGVIPAADSVAGLAR